MNEEVELREYLRMLWEKKWVVVIVFLVAIGIAAAISFTKPVEYRTNATLAVNLSPSVAVLGVVGADSLRQTLLSQAPSGDELSAILVSDELLKKVIQAMSVSQPPPWGNLTAGQAIVWMKDHLSFKITGTRSNILISIHLQAALPLKKLQDLLSVYLPLAQERVRQSIASPLGRDLAALDATQSFLTKNREALLKELDQRIAQRRSALREQQHSTVDRVDPSQFPALTSEIEAISGKLVDFRIVQESYKRLQSSGWGQVNMLSAPSVPLAVSHRKLMLIVAAILGLLFGVLLALFVHYLQAGRESQ